MATNGLARTLSSLRPAGDQRPWPRYAAEAALWTEIGQRLGAGEGDLLALWGEPQFVHLALRAPDLVKPCVVSIAVRNGQFPSIGRYHAPAIRLERAIHDLYGHVPGNTPDDRPWLDHGAWGLSAPLGKRKRSPLRDPAEYKFLRVAGHGMHQIPVGPVHAGIIEPGHFRFTVNGEHVARLEQRLGYVHKGIDGLLIDTDIETAARIAARVSGDSTVAYSFAFAAAVEAALDIEAPPRAQALRGVMAELERMANHFGDIGAICNDASFVIAHAHCGIFRERVLAAADQAFGHRLMMDAIVPGGIAADISPDGVRTIRTMLDDVAPHFAEIIQLYDDTPSLQDRTCTTGIVGKDLVAKWAAGGHVGRASGRDFDTRRDLTYAPYDKVKFDVPAFTAGDVDARVWVRIREVEQSMRMLRHWLKAMPSGSVRRKLPVTRKAAEGIAMTEAFRGDVFVWVRVADGRIAQAHARDASWFQWPLLEAAIEGNIVADFPLCNKSFNCSYSGHDL
ncbi:MAG: hydrogenase expression protein HypE [Rhizobiales bacterium]|nr:hydrogenase expression protein HypE [Hyphomicrobiales bacterium]